MSTPQRPDDRLAELLADAVSDVEPGNRLEEIRERTKVTAISSRRPWLFAAGGAVVATAAVITAIALAGAGPFEHAGDPGPADHPSQEVPEPSPGETTEPSDGAESPTGSLTRAPLPVYLVSETPAGLRLFREFQPADGGDPLLASVARSVEGDNLDGDYRSLWPVGSSVASVTVEGDVLLVDVTGAPRELPAELTEDEAALALQQVVYTAQAAYGEGRVPVQLLLDGERSDQALGQPTSEPLSNTRVSDTLSQMQVNYPNEGDTVPDVFTADGVNNAPEATFQWWVRDGDAVLAEGFGTADGCCEVDELFPWSTEIDVTGLEPGAYTLIFSNSDPSGGAEGAGPHLDNRTIFVE